MALRQNNEKASKSAPKNIHIFHLTLIFLILFLFLFFFTRDTFGTNRWFFMLTALLDPQFVPLVWFGSIPFTNCSGERAIALALGLLAVTVLTLLGNFLIIPFKKLFAKDSLSKKFFAIGLGYVFCSFIYFIVSQIGLIKFPIFPTISGIVLLLTVYLKFFSKSSKSYTDISFQASRFISKTTAEPIKSKNLKSKPWFLYSAICLFVSFYLFASTQPIFEYDALEYHVQGAREIFENGKQLFSSHNVYMNMPLGTEMFYITGFDIARDLGYYGQDVLRIGSLIGKTIISSVGLLVAFGLFTLSRRIFPGTKICLWAPLIFLSTPSLFENFSNGLNDGVLGFALFSSLYAIVIVIQKEYQCQETIIHTENNEKERHRYINFSICGSVLIGIFVGFTITIKYTAVIFILLPICFFYLLQLIPGTSPLFKLFCNLLKVNSSHNSIPILFKFNYASILASFIIFILTVILLGGGWYFRNLQATGNPFYPLAYSLFGDSSHTWNDSLNLRWNHAHSSQDVSVNSLEDAIKRSSWNDTFSSPFFVFIPFIAFGFFFYIFLHKPDAPIKTLFFIGTLIFCIFFFWIGWYLLTHRLTRFLTPIIPLCAMLLGWIINVGLYFSQNQERSLLERSLKNVILIVALFNLAYSAFLIDVIGQGRMAPLKALEHDPARFSKVAIYFNDHPEIFYNPNVTSSQTSKKIALIGDAKAFAFKIPVLYSTCWNDSPLKPLFKDYVKYDDKGQVTKIKDPIKIRENLEQAGIAFILVDYAELARFRSKGNYGFNDTEFEETFFQQLVNANVIKPYKSAELNIKDEDNIALFEVCSSIL